MASCPDIEQLELLAEGQLDSAVAGEVRSHVGACDACRHQFEECCANQEIVGPVRSVVSETDDKQAANVDTIDDPHASGLTTPVGSRIAGYRLVRQVGRGGQGFVYEAVQESPHRRVAVKVLLGGQFADPAASQRFEREIELAAALDHHNVVTIHGSGLANGLPYFVMDFVHGVRLDEYAGPSGTVTVPVRDTLRLFQIICRAVNYAHQRGVIHRDLKPSNILVTEEGEPKLLDFGIAKQTGEGLSGDPTVSFEGHFLGTLRYMSPEHTRGVPAEIDVLSDIYCLGVILYELLTGEPPYGIDGPTAQVMENIASSEPRRPSASRPDIDDEIETIVLKALSKEKERRYQTAGDLADDIERYLTGETVEAKRNSRWYVFRKTVHRYRTGISVAVATVMVVLVALIVSLLALSEAKQQRREAEWRSYLANIGAADSALRLNDVVEARVRLESIPDGFHKNWEWSFLYRRLDQSIARLPSTGPEATCAAFGMDGKRVIAGSGDGTVRIWDISSGKVVRARHDHTDPVTCLDVVPASSLAVTGDMAGRLQVWNTADGRLLHLLPTDGTGLDSVALSAEGRFVAAGFKNGQVQQWNLATGEPLESPDEHAWNVKGLAFAQNGNLLVTADSGPQGKICVWDGATATQRWTQSSEQGGINDVAVSPDGRTIVSAGKDGTLAHWNLRTGDRLDVIHAHDAEVNAVAYRPDGAVVATASADRTIRLWTAEGSECLGTLLGHQDRVVDLVFSPDSAVLVTSSVDGTIRLWDTLATASVPTLRGHTHDVHDLAFNSDGSTLATASRDHTVKLWNIRTGGEIGTLKVGHQAQRVAFSPDGLTVAVATGGPGYMVKCFDVSTRQETQVICAASSSVQSLAFSPDGSWMVTGNAGGTGHVWDSATGEQVLELVGHTDDILSVAFSPDGGYIASGSADASIRIWDSSTGQQTQLLAGHDGSVAAVAIRPDGTMIASASADRTIKTWDVASGKELGTLRGHAAQVQTISFHPDGWTLASGADDNIVKIWDVGGADAILTLRGHDDHLTAVAFSPDGNRLASASLDRTVVLWNATKDAALDIDIVRAATMTERHARRAVEIAFANVRWPADALRNLEHDDSLSPPEKLAAKRIAHNTARSLAFRFEEECWDAIKVPLEDYSFSFSHALVRAQAACEVMPNSPMFLKTLGAAQFRVGLYAQAVETLVRADQLITVCSEGYPSHLPFLAMSHFPLGNHMQARAVLSRLDHLMPAYRNDPAVEQPCGEAKSLILDAALLPGSGGNHPK